MNKWSPKEFLNNSVHVARHKLLFIFVNFCFAPFSGDYFDYCIVVWRWDVGRASDMISKNREINRKERQTTVHTHSVSSKNLNDKSDSNKKKRTTYD